MFLRLVRSQDGHTADVLPKIGRLRVDDITDNIVIITRRSLTFHYDILGPGHNTLNVANITIIILSSSRNADHQVLFGVPSN